MRYLDKEYRFYLIKNDLVQLIPQLTEIERLLEESITYSSLKDALWTSPKLLNAKYYLDREVGVYYDY